MIFCSTDPPSNIVSRNKMHIPVTTRFQSELLKDAKSSLPKVYPIDCLFSITYNACHLFWKKEMFYFHFLVKPSDSGVSSNNFQGSKIALVRSYLWVPQAAGQVKILIFPLKIKFFPMYANIFCDAGQVPILRYFEAWLLLKTREEMTARGHHCWGVLCWIDQSWRDTFLNAIH